MDNLSERFMSAKFPAGNFGGVYSFRFMSIYDKKGENMKDANEAMQEAKEKEKAFKKRRDDMPENVKNALQVVIEAIEKKRKENL